MKEKIRGSWSSIAKKNTVIIKEGWKQLKQIARTNED